MFLENATVEELRKAAKFSRFMELSKDEEFVSFKPAEEVDADTGLVIFGFDVGHIR